jgi:hypothetical protein
MIPLEIADGIVSDSILALGHVEYFERRVVSGDSLDNEAAAVGPEICELKLESLALKRQRQPARVELVPAGRTVEQVWKALDKPGKRRLLLQLGYAGKSVFQRDKPRVTAERSREGMVSVGIEPPELLATIAKLRGRPGLREFMQFRNNRRGTNGNCS